CVHPLPGSGHPARPDCNPPVGVAGSGTGAPKTTSSTWVDSSPYSSGIEPRNIRSPIHDSRVALASPRSALRSGSEHVPGKGIFGLAGGKVLKDAVMEDRVGQLEKFEKAWLSVNH